MRGSRRHDHLPSKADWFYFEQEQVHRLTEEINSIAGDRLLNTSVDDLCQYFAHKYRIDIPTLVEDQIVADQHEVQIDVSQDPLRYIRDRSRPFHVSGKAVEVAVLERSNWPPPRETPDSGAGSVLRTDSPQVLRSKDGLAVG